jgi:sugar/nucleoside kinase (ribokinase family)/ribulose-5-phosphate 4-epimerase/fuculose-1-phosphate aldolase
VYRRDAAELNVAREQLVTYSARLVADGLAVGSAGNLSTRCGDFVAITPSGIDYGELTAADIAVVGMDGAEVDAPEVPSTETPMHLAIYAATSAAAIVHTHSPEVIALSAHRDELPAIHYAIAALGGPVRVAPYVRFGSAGLADAATQALTDRRAAILRNHGAICYARDLRAAYDNALLLEWLARVYRLALSYGEPQTLTNEQLAEVSAEARRRGYGTRREAREGASPVPRGTAHNASGRDSGRAAKPLGRVAVLGAHIVDVLGRPVESIPPGQGSARLTEIRATVAGTAAGTAVDLAKLGAEVAAFGAVGDDMLADLLIGQMRRHGIDTTGLVRKPGAQTSATMLPIRPNGERPALHVPGATALLDREDLDLAALSEVSALLVGAPDALGGLVGDGLTDAVAAAKAAGALIVVDVLRPGSTSAFARIAPLLAQADWFAPNADQLLALTGEQELVAGIDRVLSTGTGGVAVTLGADGALVATRGREPEHVPAIAVDVVDTTGCGDGFSAGLIAGLLLGASPVDAAWLGVACGALVATGLGSDAGIGDLDQVLSFLSQTSPAPADRLRAVARPAAAAGTDH